MKKHGSGVIVALMPLFAVSFVSHIAPYIYIPSLPDIAASFEIDTSRTGGLMSAYYLTLSLTLLVAGVVGDRLDKRKMLCVATCVIFAGAFLSSLPFRFGFTLVGWGLQGAGAATITIIGQTWIGQASDKNNVTSLYSYMSIALSFAPLIAPVLGGLIAEIFSWECNFYIVGILCLLSAIPVYRSTLPAPLQKNVASVRHVFSDYVKLLFRSKLIAINGTSLVCFLFQGMLMAYSSFLFIDQLGLTPASFGLISVPVVVGSIIGQFPVMYLEKRYGLTSAFIFNSVIAVVALSASLVFYAVTGTHTVTELAIVIFLFSIGFGGHTLLATRNTMTEFSFARSYSSALMNFLDQFAGYIAAVSVQVMFAFISSAMMAHNFACGAAIILIIFTSVIYVRLVKSNERSL
ncbi:MAG: MFS transporter [Bacteroidales bacterium]|nr:MFS transporter [Bacteroidales bacterium]